jgi:hypothetical protein
MRPSTCSGRLGAHLCANKPALYRPDWHSMNSWGRAWCLQAQTSRSQSALHKLAVVCCQHGTLIMCADDWLV